MLKIIKSIVSSRVCCVMSAIYLAGDEHTYSLLKNSERFFMCDCALFFLEVHKVDQAPVLVLESSNRYLL